MLATVKCLGVYISACSSFKCSYDHVKLKFHRALNCFILSKSFSELISIELVKAYCLPLLLYAVESTVPDKQDVRMIDRCIDVVVR